MVAMANRFSFVGSEWVFVPFVFQKTTVHVPLADEPNGLAHLLESTANRRLWLLLRFPTMARRLSLAFLAVASPVMLALFFMPWPWAQSIFAILVMGYPVALIAVAVGRRGGVGPLGLPLLALLVFLEVCAIGMLLLRGHVTDAPWFGGLPAAAAIQLYGLFLTPLLLVALTYALTFDRFEMKQDDLDRLEKIGRRSGDED
jgi:hypothetical protein